MGLKILHTADWHMDAPFSSVSEERRAFLHQTQMAIPGKIADLCHRENCDLMLLAGDIFDGIPSRETVDTVRQALKACGVPVFVSPGNHDFCGVGSPWLEESWPKNVMIFTGALETVAIPELNCRIHGAGYQSMDCGPLLEGFHAGGEGDYQIGLLHGDPLNQTSTYCPITAAQVRESGLHYLALGHIHKAGKFRSGSTLCAWPGCPMGRGWDETGEKGVCLVTLDSETSVQFLPLDGPRFYDWEADATHGAQQVLDAMLPAAGSDDFFRITLTGEGPVDLEALGSRYAAYPNLFLRDRTDAPIDLWADMEADTFRGAYFRLLHEQARQDPRAVLAAEISRKILSGREVKLP